MTLYERMERVWRNTTASNPFEQADSWDIEKFLVDTGRIEMVLEFEFEGINLNKMTTASVRHLWDKLISTTEMVDNWMRYTDCDFKAEYNIYWWRKHNPESFKEDKEG